MALPAAAQFYSLGSEPAFAAWRHIRTADYDVIYPRGLDSLAQVYAAALERQKMPVGVTAGYYPNQLYKKQLPVILHPWTASTNGMVAWTPRRMELLTTPDANVRMPQPWVEHLVTHESRHVAQMQFVNEKPYRPASWLLGEFTAGAVSAIYCGPAFYEGDAVVAETELSRAGRGRNSAFLEYYRAAFREGDTRNYWRWRYGSLRYFTPDYYTLGYITMAGMRDVYDVPDFTARYYGRLFRKKWPLPLFNMQGTVKEVSGKRFKDAFAEITDTLGARWNRDEAARAPFMPSRALTADRRHYTEYSSNCYMDSLLYSVRSGMTMAPQLVRIDTSGRETYLVPFSYSVSPLKGSDAFRRIYWSEVRSDPRWDLKSYSEIWFVTVDGCKKRISSRTRWYNPAPSEDGSLVSVTEYPVAGGTAIVLLDALSFKAVDRLAAPDGMQLVESDWVDGNLYASAVTDDGFGIYRHDESGWTRVLDCGNVNMKGLFAHDGRLCFTSDLNGVDELYAFDPAGGAVVRLTSSVQGGGSYRFSPDGQTLAFSVPGRGGRNLHLTSARQLPDPVPADFSQPHRFEFAETLAAQGQQASGTVVSSDSVMPDPIGRPSEPYNRLANLFRFHSWAPVYVDYDAIADMSFESITSSAGLGATAFFQNHLNTMQGSVAYNAGFSDGSLIHKAEAKFTYSGFYPVIETSLTLSSRPATLYFLKTDFTDFSYRVSLGSDDMSGLPSFNAGVTAYVPFRFNYGGWYRGVVPQIRWNISNSLFTHGSFAPMNRLSLSLRAYAVRATPPRRIYPSIGGGAEVGWSGRPWAQNILSSCAYFYTYGYLPGLMDTHGVRLSATFQTPVSDAIFNERYVAVLPRGMSSYVSMASSLAGYPLQSRFTTDYAFPFAPLDWSGLGPVAYVRNLECTLHGDFSYFKGEYSSKKLASFGADLCAILGNLLWIPSDTRIGVSYYYNIGVPAGKSPHYWGAVFNVDF